MPAEDEGHYTAFAADYESILARARQMVSGFPPALQELGESFLPSLTGGSFARIVALLPYWVADLLAGRVDLRVETETLGLANLLGWGYYQIQDSLLDRDFDCPELLPLAFAFHAAAVRLLIQVLPGDQAFWDAFQVLSLESTEALAWERRRHFPSFADLATLDPDSGVLDLDDLDRLAGRSALLRLAGQAPLSLRGCGPEHSLSIAVTEMLRHYAIARQIADDRSDWIEDLRRSRLNYVSGRILRRMRQAGAMRSYAELDAERLVGYWLYDDGLFAAVQDAIRAACEEAAQALAPYGHSYLAALVGKLAVESERSYQAALEVRRSVQALFAPLHPLPHGS